MIRLGALSGYVWDKQCLGGSPRSYLGPSWARFAAPRRKIRRGRLILRLGAGILDMCAGVLDISARTAGCADNYSEVSLMRNRPIEELAPRSGQDPRLGQKPRFLRDSLEREADSLGIPWRQRQIP